VTTFAAKTIRWGGVLLLAFIVFHILHMTLGTVHPQFTHLDPYNNVRIGLSNPAVAAFYILAMAALGLHLFHGTWAAVRTLGAARPARQPLKRTLALALAIVVAGGFIAIPVASMAGLFPEAPALQESAAETTTAAAETH
jgi:succinate dehydrogenase / fumarate reductase cytochrome b subunit